MSAFIHNALGVFVAFSACMEGLCGHSISEPTLSRRPWTCIQKSLWCNRPGVPRGG